VTKPLSKLLVLLVACATVFAAPRQSAISDSRVLHWLELYAEGRDRDFADELKATETVLSAPETFAVFQTVASGWISGAETVDVRKRRIGVAATVALEVSHAQRTQSWLSRAPFVVWACHLMRDEVGFDMSEIGRLWYRASVSELDDLGGGFLLRDSPDLLTMDGEVGSLVRAESPGGHLGHALQRFPSDARFQLAEVELRDDKTLERGSVESHGWLRSFDAANSQSLTSIEASYEELTQDPEINVEVRLRLAFLLTREHGWQQALAQLALIQAGGDSDVRYFSEYIKGWALEHLHRRSEAIAAYDLAASIAPGARGVSTLLAAQLFQNDDPQDRDRAFSVLDNAIGRERPARDPWDQFFTGQARAWPTLITNLRRGLR